ncbi:solute carrier family 22 member 12-like [Ornithodoros turicata]|uniref:solute carrier family 22 member 12-like n=1 Tax=Ornithodoros turicata TaxID=34597 RepID=UPI00313874AB
MYPTQIRTLAMGLYVTISRIGAMTAPFTKELGVIFDAWVPRAVDSSACALLVLLGMCLPETLNLEFPDTIEDVKQRSVRKHQSSPSETDPLCGETITSL